MTTPPKPPSKPIFIEIALDAHQTLGIDINSPYFVYATVAQASAPDARFYTEDFIDDAVPLAESFHHGDIAVFKDGEVRYVHKDGLSDETTFMDGNTWAKTLYHPSDLQKFLRQMEEPE